MVFFSQHDFSPTFRTSLERLQISLSEQKMKCGAPQVKLPTNTPLGNHQPQQLESFVQQSENLVRPQQINNNNNIGPGLIQQNAGFLLRSGLENYSRPSLPSTTDHIFNTTI